MMNHQQFQPNDDIPFFRPILQYYNALPSITRTWFTLSLITTALHTLEIFDTEQLIFIWDKVVPPKLEIWRILTCFAWAGPGTMVDFSVLLLLYSMVLTVPSYERNPHEACWIENEREVVPPSNNPELLRDRIMNRWMGRESRSIQRQSDCIFAFLLSSILIVLSYILVTETSMLNDLPIPRPILLPVFTRTLLYTIITLQSLQQPNERHNINFFPVPGRYVPLFHVGFGILMGYRINETTHGIAIAFVYDSLVKEDGWMAKLLWRRRVLSTPQWLIHLVGEDAVANIGTDDDIVETRNNANPPQTVGLEQEATILHRAAAVGDVSYIQSQINRVEMASSPAEITAASAPFRQGDMNGWQPLHETARSGHVQILKLILEVDNVGVMAWRRRAGKLKINVNARTNNDRGFTALRLVEEHHGPDNECAQLLRAVGGVSLGFGDNADDDE
ncbi:hypothetical protein ACHAXH_009802 [Discostella pseudostelligera]